MKAMVCMLHYLCYSIKRTLWIHSRILSLLPSPKNPKNNHYSTTIPITKLKLSKIKLDLSSIRCPQMISVTKLPLKGEFLSISCNLMSS